MRELHARMAALPMGATFTALPVIEALRHSAHVDLARALVDEMRAFARDRAELVAAPVLERHAAELAASPE